MRCDGCEFAKLKMTVNGRMHPDKSGRCTRLDAHPLNIRLPPAFYWVMSGGHDDAPTTSGGYITRGQELRRKCDFKSVVRS